MMLLLNAIRKKNNFKYISHVLPRERHYFLEGNYSSEVNELVNSFGALSKRKVHKIVYVRHLYYLDLQKDQTTNNSQSQNEIIQYFNIIKHPIEQYISYYYYLRNGFKKSNLNPENLKWQHTEIPIETRNLTLDECILKNFDECTRDIYLTSEYLNYFCGHDFEICRVLV